MALLGHVPVAGPFFLAVEKNWELTLTPDATPTPAHDLMLRSEVGQIVGKVAPSGYLSLHCLAFPDHRCLCFYGVKNVQWWALEVGWEQVAAEKSLIVKSEIFFVSLFRLCLFLGVWEALHLLWNGKKTGGLAQRRWCHATSYTSAAPSKPKRLSALQTECGLGTPPARKQLRLRQLLVRSRERRTTTWFWVSGGSG